MSLRTKEPRYQATPMSASSRRYLTDEFSRVSLLGAFLRRSGVALSIPRCLLLSLLPSSAQSPLGPSSTSSCPNKTQYTEVNTHMQPPADVHSRFFLHA